MAQSQPYLGGYVLLCGWYKQVIRNRLSSRFGIGGHRKESNFRFELK